MSNSSNNERITAAIQQMLTGAIPSWRRPWRTLRDSGAATMPRNAITGRAYRGINTCILFGRQDADMRYLTYNQARDRGGYVRKGEHGEQVIFWQKRSYKTKDAAGEELEKSSLLMRMYTVFNLAQCDGVDLPKPRDAIAPLAPPPAMTEVYAAVGAAVHHGGDRACYAPGPDRITMPAPEAFSSPDGYSATALHELTHWTGHNDRLARDLSKRFGSHGYACEELVAELGSAFLCAELGIDSALEHHASYIESWRSLLADDSGAIITAASKAQAATDFIFAKIRPTAAETFNNDEPAQNIPISSAKHSRESPQMAELKVRA
jgi:antirestriction protein ArdC